jgi:hypothetical protein
MRNLALVAVTILAIAVRPGLAGLGTTTGKERERWTTDRYNVVVASIRGIEKTKDDGAPPYRATISPLATLAGSLDPSAHPDIPVTFYVSDMTSSIRRSVPLPKDGATVLAVVQMSKSDGDTVSGFIVSDICTFMPDESALVEIKGLDDPRVIATLKKLQAARAKPEAERR